MINTTTRVAIRCLMLALAAVPVLGRAETVPLTQLQQTTHFHGIAVDPRSPGHIYLATHHGFFSVAPDGQATRLSSDRNDYMGFTPHPQKAGVLFATGHPERGGNMGFIRSDDGGTTWRQLSKGAGGPVDFHQMDVSRADPNHVYGIYRGNLQHSADGGESWSIVAAAPQGLLGLAASAHEASRLFAATRGGLLRSDDGGRSWRPDYLFRQPAPLVYAGPGGTLYAFMIGRGLLRADESRPGWRPIGPEWGDRHLIHLAEDPVDAQRLYAIANDGEILVSRNGGLEWSPFGS